MAWKTGRQGAKQPTFAPSDRRFNGSKTKISASIASDQGGNKRAVNVSKRAAFQAEHGFRTVRHCMEDMEFQVQLYAQASTVK